MSRILNQDPQKSIPVLAVLIASGAATNAAESAGQSVAVRGRKNYRKERRRTIKIDKLRSYGCLMLIFTLSLVTYFRNEYPENMKTGKRIQSGDNIIHHNPESTMDVLIKP